MLGLPVNAVMGSIDFDDQSGAEASEIWIVAEQRRLASEVKTPRL